MRGTLCCRIAVLLYNRITPAHAGNTLNHFSYYAAKWDHPRTCGEHDVAADDRAKELGSPPHMRGTPGDKIYRALEPGITPAHAGNTEKKDAVPEQCQDHPRTCGEHPGRLI